MNRPNWMAAAFFLCAVGGCAQATTSSSRSAATVGPHGGFAVKLPNDAGFAEVVVELAAVQGIQSQAQIAVYFLANDLKSPLSQLPSGVSVKLVLPDKDPQTITLSAQPKSDDAAGAGRFASPPGASLMDEPIGELTATIAGQTFTAPFSTVR